VRRGACSEFPLAARINPAVVQDEEVASRNVSAEKRQAASVLVPY
jgi:hypothetical protein